MQSPKGQNPYKHFFNMKIHLRIVTTYQEIWILDKHMKRLWQLIKFYIYIYKKPLTLSVYRSTFGKQQPSNPSLSSRISVINLFVWPLFTMLFL